MTIPPLPTGFIPSDLRTYDPDARAFPPFGLNRFLGGVGSDNCSAVPCRMPEKSSADIVDYTVDLTTWLSATGDSIASVEPAVHGLTGASCDLTAIMAGDSGKYQAVAILASGLPGLDVTVLYKITTVLGLSRVISFVVPINTVTSATDPPSLSSVVALNGHPVTLNSSPVTLTIKS